MGSFVLVPELILISGLVLAGLAVYFFMSAILTNNTDKKLLSWASGDEPAKSHSKLIEFCRPLVHQFTLQHAARIKSQGYRKRIGRAIIIGGLSDELNVDEFIGLQIFLGVFVPIVLTILNFTLELNYSIGFCIALGALGFYYPLLYAKKEYNQRAVAVRIDLPFFIDLLSLSTISLDFFAAIQKIVEKADPKSILAQEFRKVLGDVSLGSPRADALKRMAERLDVSEVSSLVSVLIDADITGASISQVLKDQAEQMRMERFVRAEKAGARASQAILIPLVVFIMPAVLLMVFGPIAVNFFYGGGK